LFITVKIY